MMNILAKFKIHFLTYLCILIACLTGYLKNIFLILLIICIHELGHILWIKHYEYEIEKIEIFPFGGVTTIRKPINTPLKEELSIALGGVSLELCLIPVFVFLYHQGFINPYTYQLFHYYNKAILLFNILPIIPLDGSIFFHSLLEFFLPYKKAYQIFLISSAIMLFIFLGYLIKNTLNNYMIASLLLVKFYDALQNRQYIQNKFYLERYLYEIPYEKIESHPYPALEKLKKDTLHFFWYKDRYLHEKVFLQKHFHQEKENTH